MKLRIVLGVVILFIAYFVVLCPRLTRIGGDWAIGRRPIGSSQSLVRTGHLFGGRTVARGVTAYQFYNPDCVIYTATSSFDGHVFLAACGERMPITVAEGDIFTLSPWGLRYVLKHDTFDTIPKTIERHIPLGRIFDAAKKAPPYSMWSAPRSGRWRKVPVTYARYPVGMENWEQLGQMVMHDAISIGCQQFVDTMLAQGVFPDLFDKRGVTLLMLTSIVQADTGLAPLFADTLLRSGADVDAQDKTGMTALMYARRAGATNVYKLLLAWGADTSLTNNAGGTASGMPAVKGYDPLSRDSTQGPKSCAGMGPPG